MPLNFSPTPDTLDDLLAIGSVTDNQIGELKGVFSTITDRIETPEGLLAVAMSVIDDIGVVSSLVEQLLSVNHLSREVGCSVRDLIETELPEQITDSLEPGEEKTRLCHAFDVLLSLGDLVVFQRTSKAIELTYDCDNLLQRSRIMTDVRPIFSSDAGSIEGAVVSHTLRLRYDSAGNDQEMSLALDDNDLRGLIGSCERALTKAETARDQMCQPGSIPTMNSNEVPHDN